jgi:hypothetical protein
MPMEIFNLVLARSLMGYPLIGARPQPNRYNIDPLIVAAVWVDGMHKPQWRVIFVSELDFNLFLPKISRRQVKMRAEQIWPAAVAIKVLARLGVSCRHDMPIGD